MLTKRSAKEVEAKKWLKRWPRLESVVQNILPSARARGHNIVRMSFCWLLAFVRFLAFSIKLHWVIEETSSYDQLTKWLWPWYQTSLLDKVLGADIVWYWLANQKKSIDSNVTLVGTPAHHKKASPRRSLQPPQPSPNWISSDFLEDECHELHLSWIRFAPSGKEGPKPVLQSRLLAASQPSDQILHLIWISKPLLNLGGFGDDSDVFCTI